MLRNIMLFFLVAVGTITNSAGDVFSAGTAVSYAVWARPEKNHMTTLHYAAGKPDGRWTTPKELVLHKGLHVTPVIAADKKKNIWIIWVEQTTDENILRYAVIRHGKTEIGRVGHAGGEQSYAPAIVIDSSEMPWIAWSGVVEKFPDIYSSRWNGSGWETPKLVNPGNDLPEITPILGLQNNTIPWVSWMGITRAGRYVQFSAKWNKGEWNVDKTTGSGINLTKFLQEKWGNKMQLPEQAKVRLMGALFVDSGKEIQSVSERFIKFQPVRSLQ